MKKISDFLRKHPYSFAIAIIIFFFVLYFLTVRRAYPDMVKSGLFGDMFGGINALFSGFAFLGVIYAIILQRKELRLQRKELELTRKELNRSAKAQEKSEKALRIQIESMEKVAKLNGLNSVLQYWSSELLSATTSIHPEPHRRDLARGEAEKIREKIENMINDINK